jgi:hypothetical protein
VNFLVLGFSRTTVLAPCTESLLRYRNDHFRRFCSRFTLPWPCRIAAIIQLEMMLCPAALALFLFVSNSAPVVFGGRAPKPGVWPNRFQSNMSATGRTSKTPTLNITLNANLYYDFPGAQQRFDYFDLNDWSNPLATEIWHAYEQRIYEISYEPLTCEYFSFALGPLRPNWLVNATWIMETYVRNSVAPEFILADVWLKEAPLGMTQSFTAVNSTLGVPLRLAGPASDSPNSYSILDYTVFDAVSAFPVSTFAVPSNCTSVSPFKARREPRRFSSLIPFFAEDERN